MSNYKYIPSIHSWGPERLFEKPPVGIILHALAAELDNTVAPEWLATKAKQCSAHAFIWDNGDVEAGQHISREGWHAGKSTWRGNSWLNKTYLGIEILVPSKFTDGEEGSLYTRFIDCMDNTNWLSQEQFNSTFELCRYWCKQYPSIELENIIMHSQCSGPEVRKDPKHDPGKHFPYKELIEKLRVEVFN